MTGSASRRRSSRSARLTRFWARRSPFNCLRERRKSTSNTKQVRTPRACSGWNRRRPRAKSILTFSLNRKRFTRAVGFRCRIRTPKGLRAVMSAGEASFNDLIGGDQSGYSFNMPQPIPPYLMALAAGDIAFKPLGNRTGVYTEPAMLDKAAREFEDTEKMVVATEKLYGPYRWDRY